MRTHLLIPFETELRRFRQDPDYALFRNVYWAAVLTTAARKRRKPYKAPMEPVVRRGRSIVEIPFSGPPHGDFVPLH